jgi:hypothetical protein
MPTVRTHLFPNSLTFIGPLYPGRAISIFQIPRSIDWFYGGVGLPPYWQGTIIGSGTFWGFPWDPFKVLYLRSASDMDVEVFQGWWNERP